MRNIWNNIVIVAALAAALALPACDSEARESIYQITPLRELEQPEAEQESVLDVPRQVVAHIFMDVEGSSWKPLSYEDALLGVLSDTISEVHGTLQADITFEQDENGNLLLGSLQGERRHYLVACDKEDEIYAWRELRTMADAGTIYLSIYFRPWKEQKTPTSTYSDTGWTMVNKYVEPEGGEGEGEGGDVGGEGNGGED